jgi:putative pyruvate formate lyase activating enzyme
MEELLSKCMLCPRKCGVNRNKGELGYCRASNKMKIGGYHLHMWEEPIITGEYGSGTIFFSYCNLGCVYCQNYDISFNNVGEEITIERFKDICIDYRIKLILTINYAVLWTHDILLVMICSLFV